MRSSQQSSLVPSGGLDKIKSFKWPFARYKALQLQKIIEVSRVRFNKRPRGSPKRQQNSFCYESLKPVKSNSPLMHFLLIVKVRFCIIPKLIITPHIKQKSAKTQSGFSQEFSLLMTLNMQKMELSEFVLYSRANRVFDIKFRHSDRWPHWKRIPPMRCPLLYNKDSG